MMKGKEEENEEKRRREEEKKRLKRAGQGAGKGEGWRKERRR